MPAAPSLCPGASPGDKKLLELPEGAMLSQWGAAIHRVYTPAPQEANSGVGVVHWLLGAPNSSKPQWPARWCAPWLISLPASMSCDLLPNKPGRLKSLSQIKTHVMLSQCLANWVDLRTTVSEYALGHALGHCHHQAAEDTWVQGRHRESWH